MFAIWQPMLPTDWFAPTSPVLRRLSDRRVRQYWDPNHLLATQMKGDARGPQPVPDCCVRSGILWDLAAVYPPASMWSERLPPAVLFNGPVVDVIPEIEKTLPAGPRVSFVLPDATIQCDVTGVSRHHARILVSQGEATLEDPESQNGTYLQRRRITSARLSDGDEIRLGKARFTFRIGRSLGLIETVSTEPDRHSER